LQLGFPIELIFYYIDFEIRFGIDISY